MPFMSVKDCGLEHDGNALAGVGVAAGSGKEWNEWERSEGVEGPPVEDVDAREESEVVETARIAETGLGDGAKTDGRKMGAYVGGACGARRGAIRAERGVDEGLK